MRKEASIVTIPELQHCPVKFNSAGAKEEIAFGSKMHRLSSSLLPDASPKMTKFIGITVLSSRYQLYSRKSTIPFVLVAFSPGAVTMLTDDSNPCSIQCSLSRHDNKQLTQQIGPGGDNTGTFQSPSTAQWHGEQIYAKSVRPARVLCLRSVRAGSHTATKQVPACRKNSLLGGCSERTGHSPAQLSISSQISRLEIARAEDLDRWLIPQRRWMFWQFASRPGAAVCLAPKIAMLQPKFYSSSTNKLPELVLATGSQFPR